MAFQGAIRVEFGAVFPDGAYAAGKFEMVRDFDRSSGDRVVQQIDKVSGLPLWVVEVIDADEQARQRTVKVKVAAQVQPVPLIFFGYRLATRLGHSPIWRSRQPPGSHVIRQKRQARTQPGARRA